MSWTWSLTYVWPLHCLLAFLINQLKWYRRHYSPTWNSGVTAFCKIFFVLNIDNFILDYWLLHVNLLWRASPLRENSEENVLGSSSAQRHCIQNLVNKYEQLMCKKKKKRKPEHHPVLKEDRLDDIRAQFDHLLCKLLTCLTQWTGVTRKAT